MGFTIFFLGSTTRMPYTKVDRRFFEEQFEWILNGPKAVVDPEYNEVVLTKQQDRILRVCLLDSALIRKTANTKDLTFNNYLGKHEESDYRNVRWNEIRNHHNTEREGMRSSYPRRRHATFCKALFYDFYATMLMDYLGRRMWNHQWRRLV